MVPVWTANLQMGLSGVEQGAHATDMGDTEPLRMMPKLLLRQASAASGYRYF